MLHNLTVQDESANIKDHELRLHEINTLEWDDLLVPDDSNRRITTQEGKQLETLVVLNTHCKH